MCVSPWQIAPMGRSSCQNCATLYCTTLLPRYWRIPEAWPPGKIKPPYSSGSMDCHVMGFKNAGSFCISAGVLGMVVSSPVASGHGATPTLGRRERTKVHLLGQWLGAQLAQHHACNTTTPHTTHGEPPAAGDETAGSQARRRWARTQHTCQQVRVALRYGTVLRGEHDVMAPAVKEEPRHGDFRHVKVTVRQDDEHADRVAGVVWLRDQRLVALQPRAPSTRSVSTRRAGYGTGEGGGHHTYQ